MSKEYCDLECVFTEIIKNNKKLEVRLTKESNTFGVKWAQEKF